MKFTAIDKNTRRVLFSGTSDSFSEFPADVDVLEGLEYFGEGWVDSDNLFVPLPEQPSTHHVFNYTIKQWEDPRTAETEWPVVRAKRDQLLAQTDWVAARAYERGEPVPQNYVVYRQALRDITNQPNPFNITWPVLENAQ